MTKKKSIIGALLLITAFAVSAIAGGSSNSADFTITSGNLTAYTGTDTTVYVPDDTTTISAGAFNNTAIEVIYLPTTITTVEDNAFANCSADVKVVFEMSSPTASLPSGMENWGIANAGGQITTYTTSGITTYTLSDVSAIASTTKYAYIKDGTVYDLLRENLSTTTMTMHTAMTVEELDDQEGEWEEYSKAYSIIYTNTITPDPSAEDVSEGSDGTVLMWIEDLDVYFWFDGDELVMPESMADYFMYLYYDDETYEIYRLTDIQGLEYLDTSNVTDMSYAFSGYRGTELDLSSFNTSKVTNMSRMFGWCTSLTLLDVSSFDTSNVTNMSYMFARCDNLPQLNVTNFNTSKVTDMNNMFMLCMKLTSLDVTNFDTSNVTNMSSMFSQCFELTSLDVTKLNTSKVTNMSSMFAWCRNLTSLDVTKFDTSKVTNMSSMFSVCKFTTIDLSKFDTSNVTTMSAMFGSCSTLTNLDLSSFDTSNVTNMYYMFYQTYNLEELDISSFDISNVTINSDMFTKSTSLNKVYVKNSATETFIRNTVNFPTQTVNFIY